MTPRRPLVHAFAGAAMLAVVAAPARAQRLQPVPVLNFRFDVPLGLMLETGVTFNALQSEGVAGAAVIVGAGQNGGRAGVGYRSTAMMGAQLMAHAFYERTWRDPLGVPPRQGYVGADARVGLLFASVGAGVLVRVSGGEGPPVRLTASIGVGL
jgi:hypothetical protein